MKVVRIYSETIEHQQYPIPGTISKGKNMQENRVTPELIGISLHHLIRQPSNSHSKEIIKFDKTFRTRGYQASAETVWAYKMEILKAEVGLLI